MISYSTNWMGPVRQGLYDGFSTGRIDIYGVPGENYPVEYDLRLMKNEDWYLLSNWLDELKTEKLLTLNELINEYEKTNKEIEWYES